MYIKIKNIFKNQKNLVIVLFLQELIKEWLWPKLALYFKKNQTTQEYFGIVGNFLINLKKIHRIINEHVFAQ